MPSCATARAFRWAICRPRSSTISSWSVAGSAGLPPPGFIAVQAGAQARILILDNHDDFGGHAKRNEFMLDGRLVIGYGGSQSIDSPNTQWSDAGKGLLRELGVDVRRFETAFERNLYSSLGLSRGIFFAREAFGRDLLAVGDSLILPRDETSRRLANAKPLIEFVSGFPISEASKAQLIGLYSGTRDPLAGRTVDEKRTLLKTTSYRDYLIKVCGCNEEVANCFQGRTYSFFGLGCDAVPAADVRDHGYPGFRGLNLPAAGGSERSEPYIYHFPDGNASLARLLVRGLVPGIAPGNTMDDVVLAPFDYSRLDSAASNVRIRLDSTCIDVRNADGEVLVGYLRDGKVHRVAARHAVLACFHMMIPHLMPELAATQREALAQNVKTPNVYTNVLVRNWRPWVELKVHSISAPMSFHSSVSLDFPGQPRRLSASARSGRADVPASRSCGGRAEPGPHRAPAVQDRAGEAAADAVLGIRSANPRRSRPHARARRIFKRP